MAVHFRIRATVAGSLESPWNVPSESKIGHSVALEGEQNSRFLMSRSMVTRSIARPTWCLAPYTQHHMHLVPALFLNRCERFVYGSQPFVLCHQSQRDFDLWIALNSHGFRCYLLNFEVLAGSLAASRALDLRTPRSSNNPLRRDSRNGILRKPFHRF